MILTGLNLDILALLMDTIESRLEITTLVCTCRCLHEIGMRYLVRKITVEADDMWKMESFCAFILRRPHYGPCIHEITWTFRETKDPKIAALYEQLPTAFANTLRLATSLTRLSLADIELLLRAEPLIATAITSRQQLAHLYIESKAGYSERRTLSMLQRVSAPIRTLHLSAFLDPWTLFDLHHLHPTLEELWLDDASLEPSLPNDPSFPRVRTLRLDDCYLPVCDLVAAFPHLTTLRVFFNAADEFTPWEDARKDNKARTTANWAALPHISGNIEGVWSLALSNCRVTYLDLKTHLYGRNRQDVEQTVQLMTDLKPVLVGLTIDAFSGASVLEEIGNRRIRTAHLLALELAVVCPSNSTRARHQLTKLLLEDLPRCLAPFQALSHLTVTVLNAKVLPAPAFLRVLLRAVPTLGSVDLAWSPSSKSETVGYLVAESTAATGERRVWFGRRARPAGTMHTLQRAWEEDPAHARASVAPHKVDRDAGIAGFRPQGLVGGWMTDMV